MTMIYCWLLLTVAVVPAVASVDAEMQLQLPC